MASICKELVVNARLEDVWDAVRDFGAVAQRLGPGFIAESRLEGDAQARNLRDGDVRFVRFANGFEVRELLVSIDDKAHRLVYTTRGGRTAHYNASMQVFVHGDGQARLVWVTDFLPSDLIEIINGLQDQAMKVMKQTLDRCRSANV
jgi:carbon monoxide dehydrogenase subunit G